MLLSLNDLTWLIQHVNIHNDTMWLIPVLFMQHMILMVLKLVIKSKDYINNVLSTDDTHKKFQVHSAELPTVLLLKLYFRKSIKLYHGFPLSIIDNSVSFP